MTTPQLPRHIILSVILFILEDIFRLFVKLSLGYISAYILYEKNFCHISQILSLNTLYGNKN